MEYLRPISDHDLHVVLRVDLLILTMPLEEVRNRVEVAEAQFSLSYVNLGSIELADQVSGILGLWVMSAATGREVRLCHVGVEGFLLLHRVVVLAAAEVH